MQMMEWHDDPKNFGALSDHWRRLAAAPSREAAWWRFALAPLLRDQGKSASPLPPLTYVTQVSAGSIFAMSSTPVKRVMRPVLYDHLVHGRVIVLVNLFSTSNLSLLKAFQIGGVPCASPSCKGGAGGWDTEPLGWSTETRAPLEYIDKSGVSNGCSIVRGRCNTCGATFLCTDPVVCARLPEPVCASHLLTSLHFTSLAHSTLTLALTLTLSPRP